MRLNMTDQKRNSIGTFGRLSTGRVTTDPLTGRKSFPVKNYAGPPNLRTASRSSMRSMNSGLLLSETSGDNVVSARTEALFKKTIDYAAQKGNACDERLAELIKQFNIRMPVKMIEEGKYMIGTRIVRANLDTNTVMVRVGGGYREFHEYIKCEDMELRRLQIKIEQTGLTLD